MFHLIAVFKKFQYLIFFKQFLARYTIVTSYIYDILNLSLNWSSSEKYVSRWSQFWQEDYALKM